MKQHVIILFCILLYSCREQPKIPISNTLQIALGDKYSSYVSDLNKAFEKDTVALLDLFRIDYIDDAAGYDHGFILFQLAKAYKDTDFANVLQKMNEKELNNVRQYFEVGIDANDRNKSEMKQYYPLSSKILRIE